MPRFVLHFDEIEAAHNNTAGGKGCTLAWLYQAGFPVPPGAIIVADAYRAFVAANNLDELVSQALKDDDPTIASTGSIKVAFEEAEIPLTVANAIQDAYLALGEGEMAVRSSALAEDNEAASFAGQYETFLGIVGSDAMLAAVRHCWASLWSERALAYRRRLGFEGNAPIMAVVVQKMVSAAQAGVAFTLDPISDCRDVVVVEAVAGMGEVLVGGQATPYRYIVQRGNEHPRAGEGLLDDDRLAAVVHLAQEVESWAGQPQDVEWALDEAGRVHLLQARPITAVARVATSEGVIRWTRDNVGEVVPDPVTPLTWSVLAPLGNHSFAGVLHRLGVGDAPAAGLFGRFYGRVYLNQTLFQNTMSRYYPSRTGWLAAPRLAFMAPRVLWLLRRLPIESKETIRAILERRRSEGRLDLGALTPVDVLDRVADWRRLGAAAMEVHLIVTVMAKLLYQATDKLLVRWDKEMASVTTFTTGLTGVHSAEAGQALAAIAQMVRCDERLHILIRTGEPNELPTQLAATQAGRALWTQIESFLADHGHSAAQEFELSAPRWRDDPTIILSALQAQVRTVGKESSADPTIARLEAVAQVERRLGPLRRQFFLFLLHWAQTFTVTRENLKYYFVIAHSRLRDLYLALADWLVADGRLVHADDIFFLSDEEVVALVTGVLFPAEGWKFVAKRREAWETDRCAVPPLSFDQLADGHLCSELLPPAPDDNGDQLLRGLAASPGSYTGRARIVLTPNDWTDLEPGEVLVAPATSPGWAPLFLASGALVTEIGGTLSHGAIIAREYGLPAVLNVADATRRIRTGQLVHVDGSKGVILLLGEVT